MLPLIALTFGADQVLASLVPMLGALLLAYIWAKPAWKSSLLVDFLVGGFLSHRLTLFVVSFLPSLFEGPIPMTSSEAWRCAFFEAAIPEEGVRFLLALAALQFLQVRRPSLPWEITVAQIGLGFALFENLHYAQTEPGLRFMATLCHACDGLIMGAALYRWSQQNRSIRWLWFATAIAVPVLLHGNYDGTIMTWEMLDAVATTKPAEDSASDAVWVLMNIGVVLLELTLAIFILRSNYPSPFKAHHNQKFQSLIHQTIMPQYVAFLRAINVGGHNVKMDTLCTLFEELGHSEVESFIASGNILFQSSSKSRKSLEGKIEKHLEAALGYEVATFIRTAGEISEIASHPPISARDSEKAGALNVALLKSPLPDTASKTLQSLESPIDRLISHQSEVYWLCQVKQSESKFSNALFERKLKTPATFRSLSTMQRLAKKLG